MSTATTRRLIGAAAIPALIFGFAACTSGDADSSEGGSAQSDAHDIVLASYEDLAGESYTISSALTVNDLAFMDMVNVIDGPNSHTTQDLYPSAVIEAMGEDYSDDPESAEMMEQMFADMRTEAIVVDDVAYMQFSGGVFGTVAEDFGEDAWFSLDLTQDNRIGDIYRQFGSFDLAEQTELMLTELSDVEETADGVYTGNLTADSQAMQTLLNATGGAANGAEVVEKTQVTITLDDEGLLNTMDLTLPEIEGMTMHMASEVTEIGADHSIAVPENDNLHSFDEFAGATQ